MGKITKSHCRRQFRLTPYPIPSTRYALEKVDWEQAICSVCLEAPHNAVLLLCSSHGKGCRPYMCGTSFRHSNCLDLFKKAYVKPAEATSPVPFVPACKSCETTELACPLCRGEVKGWTVVEPARRHLNQKKRSCMHDGCSFIGTYKELKRHIKAKHHRAKPRKVDPVLEEKWRALQTQTEHQDVMSTIRSTMPGALVLGDYVIDMNAGGSSDMDDFDEDSQEDGFDDDDVEDGPRILLQRRRGTGRNFDRIPDGLLYFILRGARFARLHRDNAADQDGDDGGQAVGHESTEDDFHDTGGWRRRRRVNLARDGRRRQRRRQVRNGEAVD